MRWNMLEKGKRDIAMQHLRPKNGKIGKIADYRYARYD